MDQNNTLKPYIEAQLANGVAAQTIKEQLLAAGWNGDVVDLALDSVQPTASSPVVEVQPTSHFSPQAVTSAPFSGASETPAKEGYGIQDAAKDVMGAFKHNGAGVGIAMGIAFLVTALASIGLTFMLTSIVITLVLSGFRGEASFMYAVGSIIALVPVSITVGSFISAFTQSIVGLAINDGADTKKSSIGTLVSAAFKRCLRVAIATILSGLIIGAPVLLCLILLFVLMAISPALMVIMFVVGPLAVGFSLYFLLRFTIMPTVALFEPDTPITKLYSRTKQLMSAGGALFILKLFGIVFISSLLFSFLFGQDTKIDADNSSAAVSIPSMIASAALYAVLTGVYVVFYRNRKAVRGTHTS